MNYYTIFNLTNASYIGLSPTYYTKTYEGLTLGAITFLIIIAIILIGGVIGCIFTYY
jgi:hypothetical protein